MGFCGILATTIFFYDKHHGGILNSAELLKAIEKQMMPKLIQARLEINYSENLLSRSNDLK